MCKAICHKQKQHLFSRESMVSIGHEDAHSKHSPYSEVEVVEQALQEVEAQGGKVEAEGMEVSAHRVAWCGCLMVWLVSSSAQ